MDMDDNACYRAIETRDHRFDGRLFVAVTTTGIYCRPFCPAPTPKRENVRFFPTAAAAQEAGFRPCLRCRPETSPELAFWRGSSNSVSRALGLIEAGALDDANVEALAERLGIGERQLRRLFSQHLGAIAQQRGWSLLSTAAHPGFTRTKGLPGAFLTAAVSCVCIVTSGVRPTKVSSFLPRTRSVSSL